MAGSQQRRSGDVYYLFIGALIMAYGLFSIDRTVNDEFSITYSNTSVQRVISNCRYRGAAILRGLLRRITPPSSYVLDWLSIR